MHTRSPESRPYRPRVHLVALLVLHFSRTRTFESNRELAGSKGSCFLSHMVILSKPQHAQPPSTAFYQFCASGAHNITSSNALPKGRFEVGRDLTTLSFIRGMPCVSPKCQVFLRVAWTVISSKIAF